MDPLMQRAQAKAAPPPQGNAGVQPNAGAQEPAPPADGQLQKVDVSRFVPDEFKDAVARVVAAGMKIIYDPSMKDQIAEAMARDVPLPQLLAEAVVALMQTLWDESQGGIPGEALLPAGIELLGEAVEIAGSMGKNVALDDYTGAIDLMNKLFMQKAGAPPEMMAQLEADQPAPGQPAQGQPAPPADDWED